MKNQAGLNGFAQAHFVSEQDPRHQTASHFGSDVELVGNEINPAAHEPAHPGFAPAMLMAQRGHPEIEDFRRIELPGEQAFLGFVETDGVAQVGLAQLPPFGPVENKPSPLGYRLHDQHRFGMAFNGVAHPESYAAERSVVASVFPRLVARPKPDRDRSRRDATNRTQSEFRLALTDPTLAGMKVFWHELRGSIYTKPTWVTQAACSADW